MRAVQPSARSPVYFFRLLEPGDWRRWAGTTTVAVDPTDGAIVDAYDAGQGPLANRVTDNLYAIHTGEVTGVIGRVLVLLAGLALPVLYVSGLFTWWRRRSRRR
jgi:uncharacterized iron-regulated membrane protein